MGRIGQIFRILPLCLSLGVAVLSSATAPAAEPLVADLSKHLVAITTGFAGTDVLLFGAVEGDGDVVVTVKGPKQDETVWRKSQRLGIWVNDGHAQVIEAPSYYWMAASQPLETILTPQAMTRYGIGLNNLSLTVHTEDRAAQTRDYRDALIRLKQNRGLYGPAPRDISFLSRRLFRTELHFPANVPVGLYLVEVFLVVGGQVVSAQTTPLAISKIGVGADLYDFAHQWSAVYGIIAILLAAAAGWLAARAFKK